jgi:ABC-type antimicrobial peptide transport system permease subunit
MTDKPAGATSPIRIAAVNELLRAVIEVPSRWLGLVVVAAISTGID